MRMSIIRIFTKNSKIQNSKTYQITLKLSLVLLGLLDSQKAHTMSKFHSPLTEVVVECREADLFSD